MWLGGGRTLAGMTMGTGQVWLGGGRTLARMTLGTGQGVARRRKNSGWDDLEIPKFYIIYRDLDLSFTIHVTQRRLRFELVRAADHKIKS